MKIIYKYASRSRPANFFRGLDSIYNFSVSDNYEVHAALDTDDAAMVNATTTLMEHAMNREGRLVIHMGESLSKIHAINRDIPTHEWDIIICMSDDMIFNFKGFDDQIRMDMTAFHPDTDGVLHYPDGNRGDLITMSILGRKYYDRFGYLYHPAYKSLWCDNEFTDVAKSLGKYVFIDKPILTHLHPAYGKGKWDQQYAHTESFSYADMETYKHRKADNFPL